MDSLYYGARLTVYRAILARFPPGPEREGNSRFLPSPVSQSTNRRVHIQGAG